jgi:isoleucyl-tRNA synthetase
MVCVGSIQELKELAELPDNYKFDDLHREFIDNITFTSKKTGNILRRVEHVFDCWYESGSVPYAQLHYPFENKEAFDNQEYMCDFISEGLDQTRGWFYTLLVLSTALFDKPCARHIICAGLILDEFGNKISKSMGNFVNPMEYLQEYGADICRLYLINSPTVKAEPLKFKEKDIKDIGRRLLPWYNAFKFFIECHTRFVKSESNPTFDMSVQSTNIMDRWIVARIGTLAQRVNKEMETYRLYNILPHLIIFIEELANWYIKFNRDRIKGKDGDVVEWNKALVTLYTALLGFAKIMAPFVPFMAETMYSKLKLLLPEDEQKESVHLTTFPEEDEYKMDKVVERQMAQLQNVTVSVRTLRGQSKNSGSLKMPLKKVTIAYNSHEYIDDIKEVVNYMYDELNIMDIQFEEQRKYVEFELEPNMLVVGKKYGKMARQITTQMRHVDSGEIVEYLDGKRNFLIVTVYDNEYKLEDDEFTLVPKMKAKLDSNMMFEINNDGVLVMIDTTQDKSVLDKYFVRQFSVAIQDTRRNSILKPWNKINIFYDCDSMDLVNVIKSQQDYIERIVGNPIHFEHDEQTKHVGRMESNKVVENSVNINDQKVSLQIYT